MYNILIVEDDKIQRDGLEALLNQTFSDYNIFTAATSKDGYDISIAEQIDLFILDIVLPDISGLDLAFRIRKINKYEFVWIIFITDFTQYIVSAFKRTKCYDYILKPYKKETVIKTVKKLLSHKVIPTNDKPNEYLAFKKNGVLFKVFTNDIMYIDVFNKVCKIYTKNQIYEIKRIALKDILEKLPHGCFIQCHRSYIVNINYVEKCEKIDAGWEILLANNLYKVPLGDSFKDKIFGIFKYNTLKVNTTHERREI